MVPVTPALEFDLPALCASLARGPKLLMISNPSNPVGCLLDTDAFLTLVNAAPAESVLIIDEAYLTNTRCPAPGFPDALALLREQARPWIVLRTFSRRGDWRVPARRLRAGVQSRAGVAPAPRAGAVQRQRRGTDRALAALSDPATGAQRHPDQRAAGRRWPTGFAHSGSPSRRLTPTSCSSIWDVPTHRCAEALPQRGVIVKPWKEPSYERFPRVTIGSDADNERFLGGLTLQATL